MNLKKTLLGFGLAAGLTLSAFGGAAAQDTSSQAPGSATLEKPVCYIKDFKLSKKSDDSFGTWRLINGNYVRTDGSGIMRFVFDTDFDWDNEAPEPDMGILGRGGHGGGHHKSKCDASFTATLTNGTDSILPGQFMGEFDGNGWVDANAASGLDRGSDHDLKVRLNSVSSANSEGQYNGPITVTLSVGD